MLHLTECTQRIRTDGLCSHGRILHILSKWINRTNDLSDSICSTPEPYLRPCVVAFQMDGIVPFHLEIPTLSSNLGRGDYIYQSHMAESIKYTMAKAPRWPRQTLWGTRSASWEKKPRKARIPNNFPEEEKTGKGYNVDTMTDHSTGICDTLRPPNLCCDFATSDGFWPLPNGKHLLENPDFLHK